MTALYVLLWAAAPVLAVGVAVTVAVGLGWLADRIGGAR